MKIRLAKIAVLIACNLSPLSSYASPTPHNNNNYSESSDLTDDTWQDLIHSISKTHPETFNSKLKKLYKKYKDQITWKQLGILLDSFIENPKADILSKKHHHYIAIKTYEDFSYHHKPDSKEADDIEKKMKQIRSERFDKRSKTSVGQIEELKMQFDKEDLVLLGKRNDYSRLVQYLKDIKNDLTGTLNRTHDLIAALEKVPAANPGSIINIQNDIRTQLETANQLKNQADEISNQLIPSFEAYNTANDNFKKTANDAAALYMNDKGVREYLDKGKFFKFYSSTTPKWTKDLNKHDLSPENHPIAIQQKICTPIVELYKAIQNLCNKKG